MSKNEQISVLIIVSLFCFLSEVCEASKWIKNETETNLVSPEEFWFRRIPKWNHRRYNNGGVTSGFPLNANEFSNRKKCERYNLSTCVEVLCKQLVCDCEEVYPHKQPFDKKCIKGDYANLTCTSCLGKRCVYFFCKSSSNSDGYSKFFLIAFIVLITIFVTSIVICCVCCQGRSSLRSFCPTYHRRRRLQDRQDRLNRTRLSTSSTIDLLASLDDQPPSYSEIYTVGPQNRDDPSTNLPTYEEALRSSNEASINSNYASSLNTRTEDANAVSTFNHQPSTRDNQPVINHQPRPTNNDTERKITI